MIVTERFIFVHMHKTGGQTINKIICNYFDHHQIIGYHYPHSLLPQQFADLPFVGFVRNPWDWYISWYAFNRRPNTQNALFSICSNGGKADFKTTVCNLINLSDDNQGSRQRRDALISVLPDNLRGNRGIGLTKNCIQNINDNELGYYSWLFDRMIGSAEQGNVHIGQFENLQKEFLDILGKLNVPELTKIELAFSLSGRMNSSNHSHYSCYYDSELEELVACKERLLIEKFNYRFERIENSDDFIKIPDTNSIDCSFKKLLDKENNYLLLRDDYDVIPVANKLRKIPTEQWVQSGRELRYTAHSQTQSLLLIHDEGMRHRNPEYHDLYFQFELTLKPLMKFIRNYYKNDGYIIRLLFARLLPGDVIIPHIDGTFSLLHCHRIHVPIITNDKVAFTVGGERKNMKVGELWEINNATVHGVENNGEVPRIHLIIDWVPNSTARALEKITFPHQAQKLDKGKNTGRDEPCPCGSNLKFRHCHGALKT